MFDELDKQNAQNTPSPPPLAGGGLTGKVEDIFSEVDKTVKSEPLRPWDNSSPASGTVIPRDDGWLKNKVLIAALVLGGLIIVVGGSYLGLKYAVKGASRVKETTAVKEEAKNNQIKTEPPNLTEPRSVEETAAPLSQPIEPLKVTEPLDSDQDGLTDEEEASLGTEVNQADTDRDGLSDREEVKVYGIDPLKADTDGDGYADGDEIRNGFNPKGAGKLLDINNQ